MFIKVDYFGSYPLGSDIKINNIKIMQEEWNIYNKLTMLYGKTNISLFHKMNIYYIVKDMTILFFGAYEYKLGYYHIYSVNEKSYQYLLKRINIDKYIDLNEEKKLFDKLDEMIKQKNKNYEKLKKSNSLFTNFFEIHKFICELEEKEKIITDNKKPIKYLEEILINDGPEYLLIINFHSKTFPNRKYKIGVCVRGEPLIKKVQ